MTAQPHRFSIPLEQSPDDYEDSLRAYTNAELVAEYEQVSYDFGARHHAGHSCEFVRRCRREILRRLAIRGVA